MVAVVNNVGSIDVVDGGCVGVVGSDMAMLRGVLGCVSRVCMAISVVSGVAWVLKSTSVFFSLVESSNSVRRAALVCAASSSIPGTAWVLELVIS